MLKRVKRILATVLSMAIFVNACFPAFAEIKPAYPDVIDYTVTNNELVAYFYGSGAYGANPLDAAEKELLSNGALVNGDVHAVTRPTDGDNLVEIDQENQTIKVEKFDDQNGNIWEPIAAALVVEGESDEEIALDENGEGSFTTSSNSYSVKTTYQLKIAVDTVVQTTLLNTPAILKEGTNNLTTVNSAYDYIKALQDEVPTLVDLATNGVTINSSSIIKVFKDNPAVTSLDNDVKDDGKLAVLKMLDDYRAVGADTSAKLTYLLSTSDRIDNAAIVLYNDVKSLYDGLMNPVGDNPSIYNSLKSFVNYGLLSETEFGRVTLAKTVFENIMSALEPVQYEWDILTKDVAVKDGVVMTDLATAVDKLTSTTRHNDVIELIPVDAVTFNTNVARVDVVLEVTGKTASGVTNDTSLAVKGVVSNAANPVQVPVGETKENYLDKLDATGFLAQAMSNWGMTEEFYSYEIVNDAELPATAGDEKITVKIEVTPKTFKVTEEGFGTVKDVPYGFVYGFAAHPESANDKAYIYTVDGATKEQGETYTVTKDITITRTEDRAKKGVKVNTAVGTTIGANPNEMAVLNSDAIPSDVIRVKYPSNADELAMYTKGTGVVAKAYVSGYANNWIPYSVTFSDSTVKFFGDPVGEEYIVEYTGDANDAVVEYRLKVNVSPEEATEIANYPYVLSVKAKQQKSQMDKLADQRETIDENIDKIILMGSLIKDESYHFSESALTAWNEFAATCLDANNKLKLSAYLNSYAEQGLVYYYTGGYELINGQIPALKALCEALASAENQTPLANVADMVGYTYDFIKTSLDEVVTTLNESSLVAPDALIDAGSQALSALLAKLVEGGMTEKGAVSEVYLATDINAGKQGESTVTLKVEYNGNVTTYGPIVVSSIEKLSQETYNDIMAKWADVIADADVDEDHFYYAGEETEGTALTVGEYPKTVTYIRTWKPVEYSVTVDGVPTEITFTYDGADKLITLDGPAAAGERYTYSVAGKTAKAEHGQKAAISLTVAEIDSVAVAAGEGKYTINVTKAVEDMSVVNFTEFAEKMNSAFAAGGMQVVFMPYEAANGEKVLVMRTTYAGEQLDMNSLMSSLAETLAGYNYVAMDGNVVWTENKLSVQGIMNDFIDKGFGMNTIEDLIDENGDINELEIAGLVSLIDLSGINNPALLGGKVIETTLSFGSDAATATTVKFYITLEDFDAQASKLKELEGAIAGISKYLDINSVNNKVQIDMNMPESIYTLYLTYMLAEQEITLDTFNDVELETLLTYAEDIATEMIGDLAEGEKLDANRFFTTLVLENTINNLVPDKAPDLDKYGSMLKKLVKYTDLILTEIDRENGTYNGNNYTVKLKTDDVEKVLNKINPLATSFVSDKELTVPTSLTLKNVDTDYQAYVITLPESKNITKEDVKNILKLSKDITADLNTIKGNAVVVLLDNATLTKDVVIKGENVVIDFNGFTLTGNVTAEGDVRLVDDTLTTLKAGGINGNVSGSFKVYAGNYSADVTAMVPEGHIVVDNNGMNCVRNAAYLLNESGDEYQIYLHSDVFDSTRASIEKSVVNAVINVAANLYGYNNAKVGSEMLYTFGSNSATDLVDIVKGGKNAVVKELLTYIGVPAIETITNDLLGQLKAIMNGERGVDGALLSVTLNLEPWNFTYDVTGTGNDAYIDVAYTGDSANPVTKTLSFYFEDDRMKEMAESIVDVVEVTTAEITLGDEIVWNGGSLSSPSSYDLDHSGEFDVTLDLTSDVNYSVILTTILANNKTDKAPYVAAVNKFIAEGKVGEIKTLVNNTRINELIAALKNANGKSFATMVDNMGYTGVDKDALVTLENKYSFVLDTLYKLLIKLDITGTTTKLSAYDKGAEYTITKTVYGVTGTVRVKLFGDDPEIVKLVPDYNYVGDDKQIYRFNLDETTDMLILDTRSDGITKEELEDFFGFRAINHDITYITVDDVYINTVTPEQGVTRNVIKNGAKFKIVAENNSGAKDERTFTLIILGDTNSTGIIEVGDATRIRMHALAILDPNLPADKKLDEPLTKEQLLAGNANMDASGSLEVGDCVQITKKWLSEDTYESSMENTHKFTD